MTINANVRMYPKNRAQSKKTAAAKIQKFVASRYKNVSIRRTPELKWKALNASLATVQNTVGTPLILLLNGIAQGVDYNQRTGNKIVLKQMYYSFCMSLDLTALATTTQNASWMNVALVYDKQVNGAAPLYNDIYAVSGNNSDPMALPNPNNSDRFTILAEDKLTICSAGPNASEIKKRCVNLRLDTKYGGTSNTVGNIITGALYLVAVANSSTTNGQLTYATRLLYDDQ